MSFAWMATGAGDSSQSGAVRWPSKSPIHWFSMMRVCNACVRSAATLQCASPAQRVLHMLPQQLVCHLKEVQRDGTPSLTGKAAKVEAPRHKPLQLCNTARKQTCQALDDLFWAWLICCSFWGSGAMILLGLLVAMLEASDHFIHKAPVGQT